MNKETDILAPLLSEDALDYFLDSADINSKNYHRATSLRVCLEHVVNTVFIHIAGVNVNNEQERKNWVKKPLFDRINDLKSFFTDDVLDSFHRIRKIGNSGAHPEGHSDLTQNEIDSALEDLSGVCEWTLIAYFKKHGFCTESWLPTVFSTLPPAYRVRVLESLFQDIEERIDKKDLVAYLTKVQTDHSKLFSGEISYEEFKKPIVDAKRFEEILLVIDKLAMAYLKSGADQKSFAFIDECYKKEYINETFVGQMNEKLEMLAEGMKNLPIASNIEETRANLKEIYKVVPEDERSLFITIFSAIIAENK